MPIRTVELQQVSQERFHEIDYLVMKHAFESHNHLGRHYDEVIYTNDLARRCREAGIGLIETEVPISVVHKDFSKTYFMDLLVNRSVVYELKTAKAFDGNHRRQLLNYLFLCLLQHGKLLNFRTPKVTHEFVSTTLDRQQRHAYTFNLDEWRAIDAESCQLRAIMVDLLEDWGAFLESSLYMDAIIHFLGGGDRMDIPVEVRQGGAVIGRQTFKMLNEDTAFFVTAIKHKIDYRKHLKCLLENTCINSVQWINLDKHNIGMVTVT